MITWYVTFDYDDEVYEFDTEDEAYEFAEGESDAYFIWDEQEETLH